MPDWNKGRPPLTVIVPGLVMAAMAAAMLTTVSPVLAKMFAASWHARHVLPPLYVLGASVLSFLAACWFVFYTVSVVALLLGRAWAPFVAIAAFLLPSAIALFSIAHAEPLRAFLFQAAIALLCGALLTPSARAFLELQALSWQRILLRSLAVAILMSAGLLLPCVGLMMLVARMKAFAGVTG